MIVYWSMLAFSIVMAVLSYNTSQWSLRIGKKKYDTSKIFTLFLILFIVFFCGLRDVVLDTYAYKADFNAMPTNWNAMLNNVEKHSTGQGFYFLQGCFKIFISDSHYVWFLFLAGISCFCLFRIFYKYSVDLPLSGYLFITSATFVWLINGTRQFLAVCILFAFIDWLIEGEKISYCLLSLLASTIHSSAIFVIPIALLVVADEFLSKKTIFIIIVAVVGTYFSEQALSFVGGFLDKDYSETLDSGTGSSIIRFLVVCVPAVMSFVARKKVNEAPKSIILAANMSIVAACFSFASTFTNGILVGRMTIYFSIYSLYLLPWLIKNIFDSNSFRIVWWVCFALYAVYFYYQIMVAWKGLPYISDILGIGR